MTISAQGTRPIFGLVSFLGAFLLFYLQPFTAKVITPWFGGGSHVWLACMVFAQVTLVLGYAYAHLLLTWTDGANQRCCHLLLLLAAIGAMAWSWGEVGHPLMATQPLNPQTGALGDLLWVQMRAVGLPLLVLSATAPLVQGWWVQAHSDTQPYRLYAFSNAGSLAGLLAFPLLAEPFFGLKAQAWLLAGLMLAYSVGMASLGWVSDAEPARPRVPEGQTVNPRQILKWVWIAFVGAVLLMAVTQVLNSELMGIPLLWIAPLFLYLLTFILAFGERTSLALPRWFWLAGCLLCMALMALPWAFRVGPPLGLIATLLTALFAACLLLHGYLFTLRPASDQQSVYYLALASGGVLGGLAVLWGAPQVFSRSLELPLGFLLAAAALIGFRWQGEGRAFQPLVPWTVGLLGLLGLLSQTSMPGKALRDLHGRVEVRVTRDGALKEMLHGRTVHGAERVGQPLAKIGYHPPLSGVGRALEVARSRKPKLHLGILGLGVGNVLAYGEPGDRASTYEISPKIIRLAGFEAQEFSILRTSPATSELFEGDGRYLLAQQAKNGSKGFDLLLVDAFSGGNLPWHLLTLEAFNTYAQHLAPGGFLVINVTNRLPVDRLVLSNALALGWAAAVIEYPGKENPSALEHGQRHSVFVVLAKDWKTLAHPTVVNASRTLLAPPGIDIPASLEVRRSVGQALAAQLSPWSDDFNSLTRLLWLPR